MPVLLSARAWVAHLLMLLAVAAATGLGLWQLDVWSAHREAAQRDLAGATPKALATVMSGDDPFPGASLGRPVSFEGRWLTESTLYVADRYVDRQRGYWVVTPVLVGDSAMPVVRGWSRSDRAEPATGSVRVTGWLQASEGQGVADDDPTDDVITSMRIASMTQHVDVDLYAGYVVARDLIPPAASAGLQAVTPAEIPPVSSTTALRNLLYALQWWFFVGFALYIWWRWCADELAAAGGEAHPSEDVSVDA